MEKKLDLKKKGVKYAIARQKGMSKKDSALIAGYTENTATHNTDKIESTQVYQEADRILSYKDQLLAQTDLQNIAGEQLKVVYQDKDLGAKNKAIDQVTKAIGETKDDTEDRVIIVLKD